MVHDIIVRLQQVATDVNLPPGITVIVRQMVTDLVIARVVHVVLRSQIPEPYPGRMFEKHPNRGRWTAQICILFLSPFNCNRVAILSS